MENIAGFVITVNAYKTLVKQLKEYYFQDPSEKYILHCKHCVTSLNILFSEYSRHCNYSKCIQNSCKTIEETLLSESE